MCCRTMINLFIGFRDDKTVLINQRSLHVCQNVSLDLEYKVFYAY